MITNILLVKEAHMYYSVQLAQLATAACIQEVMASPKPGLVDKYNSGAHKDMDFTTFLLSASALAPFWQRQANVGLSGISPQKALPYLRETGRTMEAAMLEATNGINTHKGLIFALSLLLYGTGFALHMKVPITAQSCANFAAQVVGGCCKKELESLRTSPPKRPLTHGEKLYLEYGLTGIRGEAEKGFPTVINWGLPALKHALSLGMSMNDSCLYALFRIMRHCEDTNVVSRSSYYFWAHIYPTYVDKLLRLPIPFSKREKKIIEKIDELFSEKGVSPGGAADLLSCTMFLYWVEKCYPFPSGHKYLKSRGRLSENLIGEEKF